jgi:hypothetical protein
MTELSGVRARATCGEEIRLGAVGGLGGFLGRPELLGGAPAFGDVLLDRHEVGDLPLRAPDGSDQGVLPVGFAVLLPVAEFSLPQIPCENGLPEVFVENVVMHPRLQDPGILPDGLVERISRHLDEPGIYVFDRSVASRDDDGDRALLDGAGKYLKLGLDLLPLRDVPQDAREHLAAVEKEFVGGQLEGNPAAVPVEADRFGPVPRVPRPRGLQVLFHELPDLVFVLDGSQDRDVLPGHFRRGVAEDVLRRGI